MPSTRPFLTAAWLDLAVVNFAADAAVLQRWAPPGTRVDLHQGRALLSLVGFRFDHARVFGCALPGHCRFPEVNLRFYVVRDTPAGPRRGVVFIREICPRRLVGWTAWWFFNEHFVTWPMRQEIIRPGARNGWRGRVAYAWRRGRKWERLEAAIAGEPTEAPAKSEEEFVIGHFYGYGKQRNGRSLEFRVEHQPWKLWPATATVFDADVTALYGPELGEFLRGRPTSAFVCDGSDIALYRGPCLP